MMKAGENFNHPTKNSKITVEPLRSVKTTQAIEKLLVTQPRDLLLFTLGINTNLHVGDLLKLKIGQVKGLTERNALRIVKRKTKTQKEYVVLLNRAVIKAIKDYLTGNASEDEKEYLFKSRKGANTPLSVNAVNALVKSWTKAVGLTGNFGSHSLRKTWQYGQQQYRQKGSANLKIVSVSYGNDSVAMLQ